MLFNVLKHDLWMLTKDLMVRHLGAFFKHLLKLVHELLSLLRTQWRWCLTSHLNIKLLQRTLHSDIYDTYFCLQWVRTLNHTRSRSWNYRSRSVLKHWGFAHFIIYYLKWVRHLLVSVNVGQKAFWYCFESLVRNLVRWVFGHLTQV